MMQLCFVFKIIINTSLNHTIAEVFRSLCDCKIEDWLLALLGSERVLKLNRLCLL